MESPSWLDKAFIEKVLRENEANPAVVVTALDVGAAGGKGENYASVLLRVTAHLLDGDKRHLLVKTVPTSELLLQLLERCDTFEREVNMYKVTLPAMNEVLSTQSLPPLCATPYSTGRPRTVLMKDLSHEGFKMADRRAGLALSQATLVLRMLARFHASSLVLLRRDTRALDLYVEKYYCDENREMLTTLMEPMIRGVVTEVAKWEGCQHFADKLSRSVSIDNVIAVMRPAAGETVLLNHGDVWVNNLLFNADGTDMRFVDFQEMHVVSPVLDLQYLVHTSLANLLLENRLQALLQTYHEEFLRVLTLCREDVPEDLATVQDLQKKYNEKRLYGLWTAATLFPILTADPTEAPDFENWDESNDNVDRFTSSRFVKTFKQLLLHFEGQGLF